MEATGAQVASIMDSRDVADHIGIRSTKWVRVLADRAGVGTKLHGGDKAVWVFTPADVDAIKRARRPVGRPPKQTEEPTSNGNGQDPDTS
jgi:hypothetical protein